MTEETKLEEVGNLTIEIPALPRLQISDVSSASKPENFRISPITPGSPQGSPIRGKASNSVSDTEGKTVLQMIMADWSGRGAHVDFKANEKVPLEETRFLGHGSMGGVYETTIRGHAFAWKKRFCRRRIGEPERKELQILKKLSHRHIIQLVGSYTHRQFLGLILYPVALCDLATLIEDAEAVSCGDWERTKDEPARDERLNAFCFHGARNEHEMHETSKYEILDPLRSFIFTKIGCIVTAVEYLHNQKIRHKDLKPSNILISSDGLWLTDFGTATDFSAQTMSTTENGERGTAKYFAPEVAAFQPSGRAADIFSLGCIILEMLTCCSEEMAKTLRDVRKSHDRSFQANLDAVVNWADEMTDGNWFDSENFAVRLILAMLFRDPDRRPHIAQVCQRLRVLDMVEGSGKNSYYFGSCCSTTFVSIEEHRKELLEVKLQHKRVIQKYEKEMEKRLFEAALKHEDEIQAYEDRIQAYKTKIHEHQGELESWELEARKKHSILEEKLKMTEKSMEALHLSLATHVHEKNELVHEKIELVHQYELEIARIQGEKVGFQDIPKVSNRWNPGSINCRHCSKNVSSYEELSKHLEKDHFGVWVKPEHMSFPYERCYCYACGTNFRSGEALEDHLNELHVDAGPN